MIPTLAKLRIYKTFILPQFTYCHTEWHFCRSSDSRKMERLQERAIRAIYCDRNSTYEVLQKRQKLSTLHNRRLQDIAIMMYKVKNNLVPPYISDLFQWNTGRYKLRNSDDFSLPRFNTIAYGKHSIRYMGPFIWSKLHKSIKMAESVNAFKSQIRKLDLADISTQQCKDCFLCSN